MEMAFGVPFLVGLLYALGVVRKIEETSGVHVAGTIEIAGPSTSAVACVAESPIDLSMSLTRMGGAAAAAFPRIHEAVTCRLQTVSWNSLHRGPVVTREERVRRVATLCCKFARYLAHYRAGWVDGEAVFKGQLWSSVNAACLDQCVLGWCELFADHRAKYHWRRIIGKPRRFASELLAEMQMSPDEFGAYCDAMRRYRDKILLESEKIPHIPDLAPADASVLLFYQRIREEHPLGQLLAGLPPDIRNYYRVSAEDAASGLYH